ncbi:MAG TPA: hypothetical protein VL400_19075 [Polyangiaceae bacterium]|nr:hypothetical protein [Polyangiaceae bacterium]
MTDAEDQDLAPDSPGRGERRPVGDPKSQPPPAGEAARAEAPRHEPGRHESGRHESGRPEASRSDQRSDRPGTIPPPGTPEHERRRLFERAVPEIVKRVVERAVESGVEKLTELSERPETLRNFVGDLRLPKEVLGDVYAQIDDTKNGLYRVVAKEIRDVLEQTQIADEIVKVLTKLSFEIKTEIRFVPNDRAEGEGEGVAPAKPKVTTEVSVKSRDGRSGTTPRDSVEPKKK